MKASRITVLAMAMVSLLIILGLAACERERPAIAPTAGPVSPMVEAAQLTETPTGTMPPPTFTPTSPPPTYTSTSPPPTFTPTAPPPTVTPTTAPFTPLAAIVQPTNNFTWPLASAGPVRFVFNGSSATTQLQRLELWINYIGQAAMLVNTANVPAGQMSYQATYDWVPPSTGTIQAFSRTYDIQGNMGQSATISGTITPGGGLITPTPTPQPGQYFTYVVQWGDTLSSIASRFNTTVPILQQLNNIPDPNYIRVGQVLIIPGAPSNCIYYTVQQGDTLYSLARRYNTTVEAIMRLNGLYTWYIYVGQRLLICPGQPPQPGCMTYYTVRWGDTLWSIAMRYGVSIWAIAVANNIPNVNLIYAGQVLCIPYPTWPPVNITGTWTGIDPANGNQIQLQITQSGTVVTGTVTISYPPGGPAPLTGPISAGSFTGTTLYLQGTFQPSMNFTISGNLVGQTLQITYNTLIPGGPNGSATLTRPATPTPAPGVLSGNWLGTDTAGVQVQLMLTQTGSTVTGQVVVTPPGQAAMTGTIRTSNFNGTYLYLQGDFGAGQPFFTISATYNGTTLQGTYAIAGGLSGTVTWQRV